MAMTLKVLDMVELAIGENRQSRVVSHLAATSTTTT